MKAEEKYKTGMFKNVHPDVMKFIHDNSNTVCPFGKYDNTIVCSQSDLIRLVNPILSQLEERNYRYCPYCSHLLSHRVDTDANTKLVCKYALCPTKTQNQTKYV